MSADFTLIFNGSFERAGTVLSDKDIGNSFDVAKLQQGPQVFKRNVDQVDHVSSKTKRVVIKNLDSISNKLDIGGELSVKYAIVSASGEGNYLQRSIANETTVSIVYLSQHLSYYKELSQGENRQLTDRAKRIKKPQELFETYGTHYVGRIYYGSRLMVTATLKCKTKEEAEKLHVAIEAKLCGVKVGEIKGNFDRDYLSESFSYNFHAEASSTGQSVSGDMNSFEAVEKLIKDWEAERDRNSKSGRCYPVGAEIRALRKPDVEVLDLSDNQMRKLVKNVQACQRLLIQSTDYNLRAMAMEDTLKTKYNEPWDEENLLKPWRNKRDAWKKSCDKQEKSIIDFLEHKSVEDIIKGPVPHGEGSKWSKEIAEVCKGILGKGYVELSKEYYYEGFLLTTPTPSGTFNYEPILEGVVKTLSDHRPWATCERMKPTKPQELLNSEQLSKALKRYNILQAHSPHRFKFSGRQGCDGGGWTHREVFEAWPENNASEKGLNHFYISQAHNPHRFRISGGVPKGWEQVESFWAHPGNLKKPRQGMVKFYIQEADDPHRFRIDKTLIGSGWRRYGSEDRHNSFWAYPA